MMRTKKQIKQALKNTSKERKITLTESQLTEVVTVEVNRVLGNFLACVIVTLRDKLGFGHKRIHRAILSIFNHYEAINEGCVEADTIIESVAKETGLDYYKVAKELAREVKI